MSTDLTRNPGETQVQPAQAGNGETIPASAERFVTPRATVAENAEAVTLELELPGVAKNQIQVSLERDELTVVGRRRRDEYANAEVLHQERPQHDFRRAFILSDRIDGAKVTAAYDNGVLRLTLPKSESLKPRKIEIS